MTDTPTNQATQPSASGSRSAQEIQADIEQTREELGDTVAALAAKTDVKAQARHRIATAKQRALDTVGQIKETAGGKKESLTAKAKQISPESASTGAQQLSLTARKKPIPFAAGGIALVGALIGWRLRRR